MKRFGFGLLLLGVCLTSLAWPQQTKMRLENRAAYARRIVNALQNHHSFAPVQNVGVPLPSGAGIKVWDLGTAPGGTWADAGGINNSGVMVAEGDAPDGDNHLFRIELFGPQAGQWTDMDALGAYEGWFSWQLIADNGLIVGYAAVGDYVHGFVWTGPSERTDIGALPASGLNNSVPVGVNKHGTLIGGSAWGKSVAKQYPVVWTPDLVWKSGRATTVWNIRALPTPKGFPYGFVYGINSYGQLAGGVYNNKGVYIAALWNLTLDGKGWELIQLPSAADWPSAIAGDINEKGEIVGNVLDLDFVYGYSALWQPVDPQRRTYKLTLLPNPWGHANGDTAEGISNSGDIVGASWDDNGNFVAVRWSTHDLTSVQFLGFPGDWSLAFRVNEYGIATGTYGTYTAGPCANDCAAAVQFR